MGVLANLAIVAVLQQYPHRHSTEMGVSLNDVRYIAAVTAFRLAARATLAIQEMLLPLLLAHSMK